MIKKIKLNELKKLVNKIIKEEFSKEIYFETLSQALDQVRSNAISYGYEVDEDEMAFQFGTGGISYEQSKTASIPLLKNGEPILSKSGKPLNRSIAVSIYRMPSGKYELTTYKTF